MESTTRAFNNATAPNASAAAQSSSSTGQKRKYEDIMGDDAPVGPTASRRKLSVHEWFEQYRKVKTEHDLTLAAKGWVPGLSTPAFKVVSGQSAMSSYAHESAPASDTSVPTSDVNMTDAPPAELTSVEEPMLEAPVLAPVSVLFAPASGQSDYGTQFASKQSAFTSETSKFKLASGELVEKSEAPPQLAHETAENNEEPIPTDEEPGTSDEDDTLDDDVAEFIKKASRYVRNAQDKKFDHDAHTRNNKRLDALFLHAVKDLRKRTFAAIWNMGLTDVGRDGVARSLNAQDLTVDTSKILSDRNAAIRCFNKIDRKQIQRQILREAVVDYTKAGRGKGKQHCRLSGTQRNFAVLPDGHYCPHNDCRKNDIAYKTEASLKRHCRDVHHWPQ